MLREENKAGRSGYLHSARSQYQTPSSPKNNISMTAKTNFLDQENPLIVKAINLEPEKPVVHHRNPDELPLLSERVRNTEHKVLPLKWSYCKNKGAIGNSDLNNLVGELKSIKEDLSSLALIVKSTSDHQAKVSDQISSQVQFGRNITS